MTRQQSIKSALLGGVVLAAWPALAADVTPQRLVNPEPQNWLMNHRTYDGQRFSPLERINKTNVKGLKLAYAVPLGGGAGNEFTNATPLVEDGFMYVTDSWGVLYKIDVTSGEYGRIVWRMGPKQERQLRNRGAALWGNLVITGRLKDIIIRGGENVSPKEVEDLLITHPSVHDVAIVAMPDRVFGERSCAFVQTTDQLTLTDIVDFLRAHNVAAYKLPERIELRADLPRNTTGKLRKDLLRAEIASILEREHAAVDRS